MQQSDKHDRYAKKKGQKEEGACLGWEIEKIRREKSRLEKQYQRDNQSTAAESSSYSQSSISCNY